jgi:hypothetical protein
MSLDASSSNLGGRKDEDFLCQSRRLPCRGRRRWQRKSSSLRLVDLGKENGKKRNQILSEWCSQILAWMDGWMDGSKKKRVRSILRHASILMMCLACLLMQWLIKCGRVVGARVKTSFDNVLDVCFAADVGVGKGNLHRCARSALERKMGRRKINDFQIGVPRFYHA